MIRIATLIAAVAVATPAVAQIAEISLLSPSRLSSENWIPRPAVSTLRVAQDAPAPAPVPAVADPDPVVAAPAPLPAVAAPVPVAAQVPAQIPAVAAPPLLPVPEERAEPSGPALRRAATVTGDIVRIGDLVENAGRQGGRSPRSACAGGATRARRRQGSGGQLRQRGAHALHRAERRAPHRPPQL